MGCEWAKNLDRPRVNEATRLHWDKMLADWRDMLEIPLLIRKSTGVRGSVLPHSTGRRIVITDNSPAQWACSQALKGCEPNIEDIADLFKTDMLPVSFAHKKAESLEREYNCTLGKHSVNKAGWKLCHIREVGLNCSAPLKDIAIETLKEKFELLLSPSNYFLIPKRWGGIGEVSEFIEGYKATCDSTVW